MVNLLVLLLITYHFRSVVESYGEKNLVLIDLAKEFWNSGVLFDPGNYITGALGLTLSMFPICGFVIEKLAARGFINDTIVSQIFSQANIAEFFP